MPLMRRIFVLALQLGILAGLFSAPAQVVQPSGITCCDEQKIRLAMTEEALARIAARSEAGNRQPTDYLSERAYESIRRLMPPGTREERIDFLRAMLLNPEPDVAGEEFRSQVGHFILGMTLEIGQTLQDEYDLALDKKERIAKLLAELERPPAGGEEDLWRLMFQADLSERELRRLRALDARWLVSKEGAPPFDEFGVLRKNITGHAADPDQRMVFDLSERYRVRFPFLDEFLEKYRRLADGFRADVWDLNNRLAALKK
jgi:hypothetical protein